MNTSYRIAVGSLMTECNHLGGRPIDLARFELYELRHGDEVLESTAGSLGGMLRELRARGAGIVPLIAASTCPGGPLTAECYQTLKNKLLTYLSGAVPVDGVLLSLHGAAAALGTGDLEGDLLQAVRQVVGENIPVVATLDLHAHVTAQMLTNADALIAFEHYPHTDTFETGIRGARMLFDILDGHIRPTMAMAKVPVIVGGVHGNTGGDGPFAEVMSFAKAREGKDGVLSTSVFLVHPYLDLPQMGGGGVVITDNDKDKAIELAEEIADLYWARRFQLDPPVFKPAEAIARGQEIAGGPILLVETADCSGGGAAGDSVHTLRALLEARIDEPALVPVVDPEAALQCHRAGLGSSLTLSLGHKLDPRWGTPLTVTGTVQMLSDGRFRYSGGFWNGEEGEMGLSAVLRIGKVQVLITTNSTYDWADEQYSSMKMPVDGAKFVVVKNPMNYRLGYGELARHAFILDTPGPTPATLHHIRYQNLQRPYYPADKEIVDFRPTILCSR